MRKIWLRNIKAFALVDDDVYDMLSAYHWYGYKGSKDSKYYVRASLYADSGKVVTTHLHRLIADAAKGQSVTFRNRNSLDCRRENLVVGKRSEIGISYKPSEGRTYKGVYAARNTFLAAIRFQGRRYNLGFYATPERAALAYDERARELQGEYAILNFPKVKDYSSLPPARKRKAAPKLPATEHDYERLRQRLCCDED